MTIPNITPNTLEPGAALSRERLHLYDLCDRHLRTVQTAIDRLHMLNGSDAELRRLSQLITALFAVPVRLSALAWEKPARAARRSFSG